MFKLRDLKWPWRDRLTPVEEEVVTQEGKDEERARFIRRKIRKKSPNDRKHIFTLLANTKDVRVSTHHATLKKVYEYLMKNIKEDPENVVESLKGKKMIIIPKPTIKIELPYIKQKRRHHRHGRISTIVN